MPELQWKYGYIMFWCLTVGVVMVMAILYRCSALWRIAVWT